MWTRPWKDTAVAITPIPSGLSGHCKQPGTNRSRIRTQNPAVIQACRKHPFIHGLDQWCLCQVTTWTLTPSLCVSATHFALQPIWLRLHTEQDCKTVEILLSLLNGLSTITIYGARGEWNWEDVDSCRFLSHDLSTITVYGAGWGRCHVTARLVSSGVARIL